jgi:hypothetical protein
VGQIISTSLWEIFYVWFDFRGGGVGTYKMKPNAFSQAKETNKWHLYGKFCQFCADKCIAQSVNTCQFFCCWADCFAIFGGMFCFFERISHFGYGVLHPVCVNFVGEFYFFFSFWRDLLLLALPW